MTLGSILRLFSLPVAVAITALGFSGVARAADQPGAAAIAGAPAMAGDYLGCATCNGAAAACDSCSKVRKSLFHHKTCTPYQTTLCPGACFGYFQTQWHRWENVCPIPYQGVGHTDTPLRSAPPVAAPVVAPKTTGSDGPVPKPLPVVPTVPAPGK